MCRWVTLNKESSNNGLANNISNPVLKCCTITNHQSILAIGEVCNRHPRLPFSFSKINREEIQREILKLETFKACQDTDITTKNIKESAGIFADILLASFNDSVKKKKNCPSSLKRQI